MKIKPYQQFISRNAQDLADVISIFHELNCFYDNQFIISMDSQHWEIFDLRISRSIVSFKIKHLSDLRKFMRNLLYDMANTGIANQFFNGSKKLKRTEYCSVKRILNLYGFDDYFITNKKLINYIVYGELNKEQDHSDRD